jgi:hypothetical protein
MSSLIDALVFLYRGTGIEGSHCDSSRIHTHLLLLIALATETQDEATQRPEIGSGRDSRPIIHALERSCYCENNCHTLQKAI